MELKELLVLRVPQVTQVLRVLFRVHKEQEEYPELQVNLISPPVQQVLPDLKELKGLVMSKVFKEPQVQLVTSKDSKGLKDQVAVVGNHQMDLKVRKG
jgi:hypothetical protein